MIQTADTHTRHVPRCAGFGGGAPCRVGGRVLVLAACKGYKRVNGRNKTLVLTAASALLPASPLLSSYHSRVGPAGSGAHAPQHRAAHAHVQRGSAASKASLRCPAATTQTASAWAAAQPRPQRRGHGGATCSGSVATATPDDREAAPQETRDHMPIG